MLDLAVTICFSNSDVYLQDKIVHMNEKVSFSGYDLRHDSQIILYGAATNTRYNLTKSVSNAT